MIWMKNQSKKSRGYISMSESSISNGENLENE